MIELTAFAVDLSSSY